MKFLSVSIVLLMVILMAKGTPATTTDGLQKGMPFISARQYILKQHWKPQKTSHNMEHLAVDTELIKQRIIEVDTCTVDSYCIFRYTRGKQCLKLVAHGENLNDLIVTNWENTCPTSGD